MIVTIISWGYIFVLSLILGYVMLKLLSGIIPMPSIETFGITGIVVTGLVSMTVYAEYFSIFYKVGGLCHGIMIIAAIISFVIYRKEIVSIFKKILNSDNKTKIIILSVISVIASFYASRGQFHTDTGIYHAQAIRLIEEYGCLKGLGNFQLHFAYNSSYLALCALFTLSFILPEALHTMTGFFMVLFTSYAILGLIKSRGHGWKGSDMARVSIIMYSVTVLSGLQSPATDYGTLYMTMYIFSAWIIHAEEKKDKSEDLAVYGYLSILAIFSVSMKLSASAIVLLAIVPLALLIKQKKYHMIGTYVLVGFLSFLPFLIRNVIISGYLIYPVTAIDLFNVVWKIPAEYVKVDSDQITAWGRALYDITKLDLPLSEWLPIWWEGQQVYGKFLILSQAVAMGLVTFIFLRRVDRKHRIRNDMLMFYITLFAGVALWFLTAPFIRYGLVYLFLFPMCALGDYFGEMFHRWQIRLITIVVAGVVLFGTWTVNYIGDDIEFIQNYAFDGYVFWPIPFENAETDICEMDGAIVYNSTDEEVNSYYYYPNTCYHDMMNRTELIGDTIKEGFKPKDFTDGD
ncbi:MAG: hypothetical protein J6O61_15800 [Butyrivibrio sp.]|uniref:LIC_10190 family membrane protein n=1 Tax=Butyrivibrio sp. TaxID=28121 RepID=UPI001B0B346C|nr:hypothetical protein [Butyrivibrio sp.]MBO6242267.1 hypothetical protein [Butyrivibrio sp.]